jgi:hypothetical protein
MKNSMIDRSSERGSAGAKFLIILVVLVLAAHAGYQYVPVAYQGASFRQEMDTAVVKGLAAPAQMKPVDVVKAHIQKASNDYQVPREAVVDVQQAQGHVRAHVSYEIPVNMLPFGVYKYKYKFDYTAVPTGYLLKDN